MSEFLEGEVLELGDFIGSRRMYEEVGSIFEKIANPDLVRMFGDEPDKVYLFYGPPGTGKTHLVDCLYWELMHQQKYFHMMEYEIGTKGTAYINMSSVNLQEFFDEGRNKLVTEKLDGIFYKIDECDVLLSRRDNSLKSHKEDEKLLNTFMLNLQRIHKAKTNEFVFFMTNFEEALDEAAMRVQRVDRMLKFDLPDDEARQRLFQHEIEKRNKRAKYEIIKEYNLYELSEKSDGMNHAEISDIPRRAIQEKIFSMLHEKGKTIELVNVGQKELLSEIKKINDEGRRKQRKIGFT